MERNAASVAHDLGAVLYVPTGMAALSLPVAALAGDHHILGPLAGTAAVGGALASFLLWRFRRVRAEHRWPAVGVIAVGWLLSGFVTALVLFFLGLTAAPDSADLAFRDPLNALFEGMSGITSTGLTMVDGQEPHLTQTAQWWRSLSQWVGGVGMVLFALGFTHSATGMRTLYEAEGRHPDLPGGMRGTIRRTATLYLGLTMAAIAALAATEHDTWAAINHGLAGIATGGFSITDDSIAGFGAATQIVVLAVIVAGAVTFVSHHLLLVQRQPAAVWRLTPMRAQLGVFVGGATILVAGNALANTEVGALDTVFQWASAAATAGFSTDPDLHRWATPALSLLVVAMFVGAPSGSTGGGWKLDRLAWVVKAARCRVQGTTRIVWDSRPVGSDRAERLVRQALALAALWIATLAVGSAGIAALTDAPLRLIVFDVTSAVSNVGLSTDVVDPGLRGAAKAIFVALMYLGRLELLMALMLATQREQA